MAPEGDVELGGEDLRGGQVHVELRGEGVEGPRGGGVAPGGVDVEGGELGVECAGHVFGGGVVCVLCVCVGLWGDYN